jgi:predicted DNA-binding protein YlxM (UPF0122 family)
MPEAVQVAVEERTNGKQSHKLDGLLDTAYLLRMRYAKKMSYAEIGKQYGVSAQAIHQRFQTIDKIFNPEKIQEYESEKPNILSGIETVLLHKILDEGKLEKASINNIAYALQNINNINRLHRGQSTSNHVNLNVELGDQRYQEFLRLQNTSIVNPEKEGKGNDVNDI